MNLIDFCFIVLMDFLQNLVERGEEIKHSPRDIILFCTAVVCALNLYLYFKFASSDNKTEIVINTGEVDASQEGSGVGESFPVHVSGAVNFPGVYTLKDGELVLDLIRLAGGFSPSAELTWVSKKLNLSEVPAANSRLYIPFSWDSNYSLGAEVEEGSAEAETLEEGQEDLPDTALINVNSASLAALDSLDGIGPAYAQRIIDNRPYTSLEEFISKSGLSVNLANSISEYIRFD